VVLGDVTLVVEQQIVVLNSAWSTFL
jgi:hypothetical protein